MERQEKELRAALVEMSRALNAWGLNVGTTGNISARRGLQMLITPASVPSDAMRPEMIAMMSLAGEYGAWSGPLKPSTEWRFHLDIMRARPDVGAVVHFHPIYCTALAMLQKPIPAAHYMIALFGGSIVKCTKYAPFGTKELADLVVEGLGERHAVLLGNHGALTTGADLPSAMNRARELENLAHIYYLAIAAGRPAILSDEEALRTVERFKSYAAPAVAPKPKPQPKKRTRGKTKATPMKTRKPGKKKTRARP